MSDGFVEVVQLYLKAFIFTINDKQCHSGLTLPFQPVARTKKLNKSAKISLMNTQHLSSAVPQSRATMSHINLSLIFFKCGHAGERQSLHKRETLARTAAVIYKCAARIARAGDAVGERVKQNALFATPRAI
jgi:hypothetical protein